MLTLAFAGDVMLGRLVNETIARKGFAYPWGDVLPVLREADRFLINLECALTSERRPWHDGEYKAFYFRAEPAAATTLQVGRVDFASLANNHSGDFGAEGLVETVRVLDRAGIAHAGAGGDRAAARAPARLAADGQRIAVVACADHPPEWSAMPGTPGIHYVRVSRHPDDFAAVERALAEARRDADLVVFSIHWGPNMRARPTAEFREFARAVVAAGADIFWGHSAHVVQGVEVHQGKLILYDSGDFVDDYAVDEDLRNDLSALFLVKVRPSAIESLELIPVRIWDMQVNLARGPERQWFVDRFRGLCAELGTQVLVEGDRVRVAVSPGAARDRPAAAGKP